MRTLCLAAALGLVAAVVPAAHAADLSDRVKADVAVRLGPDVVKRALASGDRGVARALADRATVKTETGQENTVSALDWYRGCHARYYSKHKFVVAGVWLATQKVIQKGYCWRAGRIRNNSGTTATRTAAFAFCWKDTSEGEYWLRRYQNGPWITPDRKRSFAQGTFGTNTGLGCVGTDPDRPTVTFDGFGNRKAR